MSLVFVIDKNKQPCNPCHPAAARILLNQGKAAVFRRFPFVIILKHERPLEIRLLRLKLDPGSKATGLVVLDDSNGKIAFAAEIEHRGNIIHDQLLTRGSLRRNRRNRKTRYRQPRFDNRTRPAGWLAPSLQSRIDNIITWARKLICYCPVGSDE